MQYKLFLFVDIVSSIHPKLIFLLERFKSANVDIFIYLDDSRNLNFKENEFDKFKFVKNINSNVDCNKNFKRFVDRWATIQYWGTQQDADNSIIYIRSDCYFEFNKLDEILENLKSNKDFISPLNYKILDIRINFLRRFFLKKYFFDGFFITKICNLKNIYYKLITNIDIYKNLYKNKKLNSILLNIPRVNCCGFCPEYFLKNIIDHDLSHILIYIESLSFKPFKSFGIIDFIFRYPFLKIK